MRIEDVVARWITEGRMKAGMTQVQLGERLGELLGRPWPKQAVSAAEKGRRAFTAAELVAFAIALSCHVEDLLQLPAGADELTLSEGPPLNVGHLHTGGASDTGLRDLAISLEHLRGELAKTCAHAELVKESSMLAGEHLQRVYAAVPVTHMVRPELPG